VKSELTEKRGDKTNREHQHQLRRKKRVQRLEIAKRAIQQRGFQERLVEGVQRRKERAAVLFKKALRKGKFGNKQRVIVAEGTGKKEQNEKPQREETVWAPGESGL